MKRRIIVAMALFIMLVTQVSAQQDKERGMNNSGQRKSEFAVASSAVKSDGSLSSDFTGDGRGVSMPLEWTNVPAGTKYFALSLWHLPHPFSDPTRIKSYWVVYNIPADVRSLPEGVKGIGIDGYNDKNKTGYDPMRSKGPGVKEYNLTIYALSAEPVFNTTKVQRSDLLKAIKGITLDECTLKYTYERGKVSSQEKEKTREKRQEKNGDLDGGSKR